MTDIIENLAAELDKLHEVYLQSQMMLITSIVGDELQRCEKCSRAMMPQRLWRDLPREKRKLVKQHVNRVGGKGKCATCVTYAARQPLSTEQLNRLREQVGIK